MENSRSKDTSINIILFITYLILLYFIKAAKIHKYCLENTYKIMTIESNYIIIAIINEWITNLVNNKIAK
jgi:hypothetical protein